MSPLRGRPIFTILTVALIIILELLLLYLLPTPKSVPIPVPEFVPAPISEPVPTPIRTSIPIPASTSAPKPGPKLTPEPEKLSVVPVTQYLLNVQDPFTTENIITINYKISNPTNTLAVIEIRPIDARGQERPPEVIGEVYGSGSIKRPFPEYGAVAAYIVMLTAEGEEVARAIAHPYRVGGSTPQSVDDDGCAADFGSTNRSKCFVNTAACLAGGTAACLEPSATCGGNVCGLF